MSGMANELEKEAAARASLKFVREGDIVGLGTGSTAAYAVRFLGERVQAGLKILRHPDFDPYSRPGCQPGDSADHSR